jgi:predicted DNA-binding protein
MHTAHLDAATAANLRALVDLTGRPEPDLLREAVAAYLQDLEDIRAAGESIRELEAGAKPLTLAELEEYLSRGVDR